MSLLEVERNETRYAVTGRGIKVFKYGTLVGSVKFGRRCHPWREIEPDTYIGEGGLKLTVDDHLLRLSVATDGQPLTYEYSPEFEYEHKIGYANMWMWQNTDLGFQHMNRFSGTNYIRQGKETGICALPIKRKPLKRIYGYDARPQIVTMFDGHEDLLFNNKDRYLQFVSLGYGTMVLWNHIYTNRQNPVIGSDGALQYIVRPDMEDKVRDVIRMLHDDRWIILTYCELHHFHERRQSLGITEEWMRDFQDEYNLDGWYFDGGRVADQWYDNYDFHRRVEGHVYLHNTVDIDGAWSGYCSNYTIGYHDTVLHGERIATQSFDDPYWETVVDTKSGSIPDYKIDDPQYGDSLPVEVLMNEMGKIGLMRCGYGDNMEKWKPYLDSFNETKDSWNIEI